MKYDYVKGAVVYKVFPRIYQRGSLHKFTLAKLQEFLTMYEIGHVIQMAPNKEHPLLPELADQVIYHFHPIPDGKVTDRVAGTLLEIVATLTPTLIQNNSQDRTDHVSILTNCQAGRNRSALISTMLVMKQAQLRREIVPAGAYISKMRQARPNSLANDNFVKFLYEYSHELNEALRNDKK